MNGKKSKMLRKMRAARSDKSVFIKFNHIERGEISRLFRDDEKMIYSSLSYYVRHMWRA